MRIQKVTAVLLVVVMAVLAVIGVLFFKVGMTTPQIWKKICYFVCASLIALLFLLLGYLLFLSADREKNYFLYDRNSGKNISLDQLRFSMICEKMNMYISVNFDNAEKLWLGDAWLIGDRFGANGEYRALVALKMLYDLADHDSEVEWAYFNDSSESVVANMCTALSRGGERNLAQKLMYIRQNCGSETAPLRSLLLGNKKYLANKMVGIVRNNIEWYYYT